MRFLFCLFFLLGCFESYCQDEYVPTFSNGPGHLAYIRKLPYCEFCTKRLRDSVFATIFAKVYEDLEYYVNRAHEQDVRRIVVRISDVKYKHLYREKVIAVCDLERELEKRHR